MPLTDYIVRSKNNKYTPIYTKKLGWFDSEQYYALVKSRTGRGTKYSKLTSNIIDAIQKIKNVEAGLKASFFSFNFAEHFDNELKAIFLLDQYRKKQAGVSVHKSYHYKNRGVDLYFYPEWFNLYFMMVFRYYYPKYTIFISLHNKHLHIDNGFKRWYGAEILFKDKKYPKIPRTRKQTFPYNVKRDKIKIGNLKTYQDTLFMYYGYNDMSWFKYPLLKPLIKENFATHFHTEPDNPLPDESLPPSSFGISLSTKYFLFGIGAVGLFSLLTSKQKTVILQTQQQKPTVYKPPEKIKRKG